jgi:ribosomal protein L44E
MIAWPPPVITDEDIAWSRRAHRYRREVADYCQLCERFTHLQVHHRRGRVHSVVGYETNDELMTLCAGSDGIPKPRIFRKAKSDTHWFKRPRCHNRITNAHRHLGEQRGQIHYERRRGMVVDDPYGYSFTIAEVTKAAHPRYLRRAIHRTLFGLPKGASVTEPRAQHPD